MSKEGKRARGVVGKRRSLQKINPDFDWRYVVQMADFNSWTPYLAGGFAAVIAWLCKQAVQVGKDVVGLQTVIKYYVERQTIDAAKRLDIPNPAPPEIRALLQKHIQGESLSDDERPLLITWLQAMGTNPDADAAERSAALQLLTGIKTMRRLEFKKRWWQFT